VLWQTVCAVDVAVNVDIALTVEAGVAVAFLKDSKIVIFYGDFCH
jgi:hypothetical protein